MKFSAVLKNPGACPGFFAFRRFSVGLNVFGALRVRQFAVVRRRFSGCQHFLMGFLYLCNLTFEAGQVFAAQVFGSGGFDGQRIDPFAVFDDLIVQMGPVERPVEPT